MMSVPSGVELTFDFVIAGDRQGRQKFTEQLWLRQGGPDVHCVGERPPAAHADHLEQLEPGVEQNDELLCRTKVCMSVNCVILINRLMIFSLEDSPTLLRFWVYDSDVKTKKTNDILGHADVDIKQFVIDGCSRYACVLSCSFVCMYVFKAPHFCST